MPCLGLQGREFPKSMGDSPSWPNTFGTAIPSAIHRSEFTCHLSFFDSVPWPFTATSLLPLPALCMCLEHATWLLSIGLVRCELIKTATDPIPHSKTALSASSVSTCTLSMDRVSQNNNDPSKGNLQQRDGPSYDLHAGKFAPRRASEASRSRIRLVCLTSTM